MKHSTRRHFLQRSTLTGLGAVAAGSGIVTGISNSETDAEATLMELDTEVARVLRSYGRTRTITKSETKRATTGSKTRRLPAFHLEVEVSRAESFRGRLDALGRLSNAVLANGNTLRFERGGRYFVIDHCVLFT